MLDIEKTKAYSYYLKLLDIWIERQLNDDDSKITDMNMKKIFKDIIVLLTTKNKEETLVIRLFFVNGVGWLNYHPIKQLLKDHPDDNAVIIETINTYREPKANLMLNPDIEYIKNDFDKFNSVEGLNKIYNELTDKDVEDEEITKIDMSILEDTIGILEKEQMMKEQQEREEELKEQQEQQEREFKEKEKNFKEKEEKMNKKLKYGIMAAVAISTIAAGIAIYSYFNNDIIILDNDDL